MKTQIKISKPSVFILAIIFQFNVLTGQTRDIDTHLSALLNSTEDGEIIISKAKSFWEEVFRSNDLRTADKLINKKYKAPKYNLNIAYLFVGLALHLNQELADYLNFLQYINFDLEPDKMDSPAEIAKLISSIIKDEKRAKFIEAILTLHLSIALGKEEYGKKEDKYDEEDFASLAKKIRPSVVRVLSIGEKDEIVAEGGGFFVGESGDVITFAGSIFSEPNDRDCASEQGIQTDDGRIFRVLRPHDCGDGLCRLMLETPPEWDRPLPLSGGLPQLDELVMAVAPYSESLPWYAVGTVSDTPHLPPIGKVIQTTIPFSETFIGCPLVNTKGEVVGVVGSKMVDGQGVIIAISVKAVSELMGK